MHPANPRLESLSDIYGYQKNVKKSNAYLPMVPNHDGWSTLTAIDKNMHRSKRRTLAQGLSDSALKTFEPAMLEHLKAFIDRLNEAFEPGIDQWSRPQDVSMLCTNLPLRSEPTTNADKFFILLSCHSTINPGADTSLFNEGKWLSLETIGEYAFGKSIGLLTKPDDRFLVDAIDMYRWRMGCYEELPFLKTLRIESVIGLFRRNESRLAKRYRTWKHNFGNEILRDSGKTRNGIFSLIMSSQGENWKDSNYSVNELWAEGTFLMLAGTHDSLYL